MKLYYREVPRGNFGDDLNPWLWSRLLPGVLDEDDRILFVGIGSILNTRIPERPFKVVFGSGVGYGKPPSISAQQWKIYCVRGPLSAKALRLPAELGITDSAVLVRSVRLRKSEKTHRVSYIPHQTSAALGDWKAVCDEAGLNFIHPSGDVETVLSSILSSDIVIAEAMHGAIVADALRVPWIPVRAYYRIPKFKWRDWCHSIGLKYRPVKLPCLWRRDMLADLLRHRLLAKHTKIKSLTGPPLKTLIFLAGMLARLTENSRKARAVEILRRISKFEPTLSADHTIASVTARLEEKLEMFKRDFASGRLESFDPSNATNSRRG